MSRIQLVLIVTLVLAGTHAGRVTADPPPSGHSIAGTAGRDLPPPKRTSQLRLAILPDRTTGRSWGIPYLKMAVIDLNRIQPDAVIAIGDMIQGYTRSVDQWKTEAEEYLDIIGKLNAPFYPLAGNHDVVSGTRRADDTRFHTLYQETFAPLYYALSFDLASVIVLFSDDPESEGGVGLGPTQRAWLLETLRKLDARGRPIFVLMHRPLWRSRNSDWWETIHPLFIQHGVRAVIGGHFHALQRDPDVDGIEYHLLGTCGGMIDQYPTAGQLQHLTFLSIEESGSFNVYHQPVGMTLPDDFVIKDDQARVFRLKTRKSVVTFNDTIRDPVHGAVRATISASIRNPLDIPITVKASLVNNLPCARPIEGSLWLSRMELDRFNRYTTDHETSFRTTSAIEPVTVQPGALATLLIPIEVPQLESPRNPPEFQFEASFTDTKGRTVPVIIRRRLPMQRHLSLNEDTPVKRWPLCAWEFTVYDLPEPNPWVTFEVDERGLQLDIQTEDVVRSSYPDHPEMNRDRMRDPTADAIYIEAKQNGRQIVWYAEPFGTAGLIRHINGVRESSEATIMVTPQEGNHVGWSATVMLPKREWDGFDLDLPIALNIGIADNDETYHTQWRWFSPRSLPALLTFGG